VGGKEWDVGRSSKRLDAGDVRAALRREFVVQHFNVEVRGRPGGWWRGRACPACSKAWRDLAGSGFCIGKRGWTCKACGAKGDLLDLLARLAGLDVRHDFTRVLELGARLAGEQPPQERGTESTGEYTHRDDTRESASRVWNELLPDHPTGRAYLAGRGLDVDALRARDLVRFCPFGWRPADSAGDPVVALHDQDGAVQSLARRRIADDDPKTPGLTGHPAGGTLVGHLGQIGRGADVVVAEGLIDALTAALAWPHAIVLGAHGASNVASICEAAAPRVKAAGGRLLLVPDTDAVGREAARLGLTAARTAGLRLGRELVQIDLGDHADLNEAWCAGWRPPALHQRAATSTSTATREIQEAPMPTPSRSSPPAPKRWGGDVLTFLGAEEPAMEASHVYWCDGLVVRDEPGLFLGEPKIGKTLVVEDLALSLAAGLPAFCGRQIFGRARVLLLTREDSDRTTRARLWQLARAHQLPHEDLAGWLEVDGTTGLRLDRDDDVAAFRSNLDRFDVVFIDSLSTVHAGDENAARDMSPVMNAWRQLALETRTAIVIVHHLRKPHERKLAETAGRSRVLPRSRGSSIIGATARHAVFFADGPDENQVLVRVEGNHEGMPEPFVIARRTGERDGKRWVRHEAVGDERVARVMAIATRLDPVILDVVTRTGEAGIRMGDLRQHVRDLVPARNEVIGQRVAALVGAERLERKGHQIRAARPSPN
jgi:hypothetical protein